MSIGKKIIVEGCDNCGKSYYIQEFVKMYPEYKIVHCSRTTPNNFNYFRELLTNEDNIIFDRAFYGQFIYQTSRERQKRRWLSLNELYQLEELVNLNKIPVVLVSAKPEVVAYLCSLDKNDSYYSEEYIKDIMNRYEYFFEHVSSVKTLRKHFNNYTPKELQETSEAVNYRDFDYDSLPKVVAVDFDGTLVYGKKFPEIGTLNEKLVKELFEGKYKDYKKILFTHRCNDNLIDACNFLADHDIHFDAINDDIPEVKKILNRNPIDNRKVWFDVIIDDKSDISDIIYD